MYTSTGRYHEHSAGADRTLGEVAAAVCGYAPPMTGIYSARLDEAVAFALAEFRGRVRKGTRIPYMTHLLQVMVLVGEHGGDEDQMIAAVLHDWLEDIDGARVETLEARWGPRVAGFVVALSDSVSHPKPPWRARKESYLTRLREEPPEVKLISTADKLHNCACIRRDHRKMGDAVWERFAGGRAGTLWYYDAVTTALGDNWSHPLLDELRTDVAEMANAAAATDWGWSPHHPGQP